MLVGGDHFVQADIVGNEQIRGYQWIHLLTVQRARFVFQDGLRQLIKSLDPEGAALRRRNYCKKCPGMLWHVDW